MSKKLILLLALALTMSACGKIDDKPAASPSEDTADETGTTAATDEDSHIIWQTYTPAE